MGQDNPDAKTDSKHELASGSDTGESAKEIVARSMEQRRNGLPTTDDEILYAHPDKTEQLKRELLLASQIRQARLSARKFAAPKRLEQFVGQPHSSQAEKPFEEDSPPQITGYPIVSEISRGGQAIVYKAIQESTGRSVALKVMSGGTFLGSRHRVRFEREAEILATFDHPNIVGIIERGRSPNGYFFVVMQYIDGLPLDTYWTSEIPNERAGLRKLIELFAKIAAAIDEAHSRGVIHRDIKPSNIRVDRRGEPHILDFGLARPVDIASDFASQTVTTTGQIIGSLPWASPEQASGQSRKLDAKSDVYSLGVVLFQALAGTFPYPADGSIDQVLLRIRTLRAPRPSIQKRARKGIDQRLDGIVLKSLAKRPDNRYATAGQLAADLQGWLAGKRLVAPRPAVNWFRWASLVMFAIATALTVWQFQNQTETKIAVFDLPSMTDAYGIKLIKIPAGKFMMGSSDSESGRAPNEQQDLVVVDHSFFIGATEVTQAQYQNVMHENPSDPRWRGPDFPVNNVSLDDANLFCARLSDALHKKYRIPTEVEYEYACRANSPLPFPLLNNPGATVFSAENSQGQLHRVAQKSPNPWGLFDMQGNVQEWCSDIFKADYFDDHILEPLRSNHTLRGGSAFMGIRDCRAAARGGADASIRSYAIGFRVVKDD